MKKLRNPLIANDGYISRQVPRVSAPLYNILPSKNSKLVISAAVKGFNKGKIPNQIYVLCLNILCKQNMKFKTQEVVLMSEKKPNLFNFRWLVVFWRLVDWFGRRVRCFPSFLQFVTAQIYRGNSKTRFWSICFDPSVCRWRSSFLRES